MEKEEFQETRVSLLSAVIIAGVIVATGTVLVLFVFIALSPKSATQVDPHTEHVASQQHETGHIATTDGVNHLDDEFDKWLNITPSPPPSTVVLPKDKPAESVNEKPQSSSVEASVVFVSTSSGAAGSGFFVGECLVATNCHVMRQSRKGAIVQLHNGESVPVVGYRVFDDSLDVMILEVKPPVTHPKPLTFDSASQGIHVTAHGAPWGLKGTVSDGLVSGIRSGREVHDAIKVIPANGGLDWSKSPYGNNPAMEWIQMTAPVDHGNSGGPLVNDAGNVIGMNTLLLTPTISFAVSSKHLQELTNVALTRKTQTIGELPLTQRQRVDSRKEAALLSEPKRIANTLSEHLRDSELWEDAILPIMEERLPTIEERIALHEMIDAEIARKPKRRVLTGLRELQKSIAELPLPKHRDGDD